MLNLGRSAGRKCSWRAKVSPARGRIGRLAVLALLLACGRLSPATFGQSIIVPTGVDTDLAIQGAGYFLVREPEANLFYVTRRGDFRVDVNGFLVTNVGDRVQGFRDAGLTEIGDLRFARYFSFPEWTDPSQTAVGLRFDSEGRLWSVLADGSGWLNGQVLLQGFRDPSLLRKLGWGLYALEAAAGPSAGPVPPGTGGQGTLAPGQLQVQERPARLEIQALQSRERFAQGLLRPTGIATDLGIQGRGFFVVRDPNTDLSYATRLGGFLLNGEGYLVNYAGWRVQGYTNASLPGIGDLQVNDAGRPPTAAPFAVLGWWAVNRFGKLQVALSDGTSFLRGQLLLRDCAVAGLPLMTNGSSYLIPESSGPWTPMTSPGYADLGWVFQGTVELSQFDDAAYAARHKMNFFVQGPLRRTGVPTDLALAGPGFFLVRDPASNQTYATRNGAFHLDGEDFLVTAGGFRLQGFRNAGLSLAGDLSVDAVGAPPPSDLAATLGSFLIDHEGSIQVQLSDGTQFTRGQVLLQSFRDLQALKACGDSLYAGVEEAVPASVPSPPGTLGLAGIQSGALELPVLVELPPAPRAPGVRVRVADLPALASVLEASTDLLHWTSVGEWTVSPTDEAELYETDPAPGSRRFYRVRSDFYPSQGAQPLRPATP
jgi:flagellar hook protein FlgE